MKIRNNLHLFSVVLFLTSGCLALPSLFAAEENSVDTAQIGRNPELKITHSTILTDVHNRMKKNPRIRTQDLAAQNGFNYDFDACDIVRANEQADRTRTASHALQTYTYRMTQRDGRVITVQIIGDEFGSPCGECFFQIPALRVTRQEILVVAEGTRHWFKRPATFALDEAALMDDSMKKVLRIWHPPYQTIPAGVSQDGTKLYVEFYAETGLDELILELSETGTVQLKAKGEVNLRQPGEWIEDHPKDPDNAYLSFMRFRGGGKTYVIRFTAPCT